MILHCSYGNIYKSYYCPLLFTLLFFHFVGFPISNSCTRLLTSFFTWTHHLLPCKLVSLLVSLPPSVPLLSCTPFPLKVVLRTLVRLQDSRQVYSPVTQTFSRPTHSSPRTILYSDFFPPLPSDTSRKSGRIYQV